MHNALGHTGTDVIAGGAPFEPVGREIRACP